MLIVCLIAHVPVDQSLTLECADYMDDSAMPILAPAEHIVSKVSSVAQVFLRVFRQHCLTLSWEPGKTEAVVFFIGTGAHAARDILYRDMGSTILVNDGDVHVKLRATRSYKHLDTRATVSDSLHDETSVHIGAFRVAFRYKKALFRV